MCMCASEGVCLCVSKMCGWGGGFQERETHAGASKYESIFLGGRTGVRMQALGCVDLHSLKLTGSDGWCLPQNEGGTGTAMVHCPISVTGGFHAFPWHEATGGTCPDIVMGGRKEVLTTGLGKEARAGAKARRANRRRKGEGDGKGGSERRKREAEAAAPLLFYAAGRHTPLPPCATLSTTTTNTLHTHRGSLNGPECSPKHTTSPGVGAPSSRPAAS